jgi:hypothetical protein
MRLRISPGVTLGVIAVVLGASGSAAAGSLITSAKIKDGTIQGRDIKKGTIATDRLASSVRTQLAKVAQPGPKGDKGDAGAPGVSGTTLQASPPQKGDKGDKGDPGPAGRDGLNPAVAVTSDQDAGWTFAGADPAAHFAGGELRLAGGFDDSTPSGGIGLAHQYAGRRLDTLTALSYDFRVLKRPAGNDVSAPTIHISLLNADLKTPKPDGFTNLVFEPYMQGPIALNQRYSFDTLEGRWWSTRELADGTGHGNPRTLAEIMAGNPDATISAISIDNGGSSVNTIPGDAFAAGADNLVVGFGSSFTRYDFGG